MAGCAQQERSYLQSYGRRRGRRLRARPQALLQGALPDFAIALPPGEAAIDPAGLFHTPRRAVWLEIGFGAGEHLAAQAEARPEIGFIGAEPYVNGIVGLVRQIEERGLSNIRIWPDDARALLPHLPAASIGGAFVLFPDPWPKARHHKRRLVGPALLEALGRVLAAGAELRLATDDPDYLAWMTAVAADSPAFEGAPDIVCERPDDAPETRYERKAAAAGRRPAYLRLFRRGPA